MMKTAIVFLLVALSCCFDSAASKTHRRKPRAAPDPISTNCLSGVLKSYSLDILGRLQEMCLNMEAGNTNIAEFCPSFLPELYQMMVTHCTEEELLILKDTTEEGGDKLVKVCQQVIMQIQGSLNNFGLGTFTFSAKCQLMALGPLMKPVSDLIVVIGRSRK